MLISVFSRHIIGMSGAVSMIFQLNKALFKNYRKVSPKQEPKKTAHAKMAPHQVRLFSCHKSNKFEWKQAYYQLDKQLNKQLDKQADITDRNTSNLRRAYSNSLLLLELTNRTKTQTRTNI